MQTLPWEAFLKFLTVELSLDSVRSHFSKRCLRWKVFIICEAYVQPQKDESVVVMETMTTAMWFKAHWCRWRGGKNNSNCCHVLLIYCKSEKSTVNAFSTNVCFHFRNKSLLVQKLSMILKYSHHINVNV